MKDYRYTLLSLAIITACATQYANADLKTQCRIGVPHFKGQVVQGEPETLPVYIEADKATITERKNAVYSGKVVAKQGNRTINAQELHISQDEKKNRFAQLKNNFKYQDTTINAVGKEASIDLSRKKANLSNVDYQLVDKQGRGFAETILLDNKIRRLKNASYTACLPDDNAWQIDATEMTQYVDKEYAEMWNARLKVAGVPIFYTPYLQIPLGDRRRTGLLMPSYSHSNKTGISFKTPFYLNIAPNMDATITPTYYSRRGWQISPEFRYLTHFGQGTIAAEYMKKDRHKDWQYKDQSRYLLYWKHNVNFLSNWRFNLDYTNVSDKQYFSYFISPYGSSTDGQVSQTFKLSYHQPNYNISISGKKFKTFDNDRSKPYMALPQIEFNYYKNNIWKNAYFHLYSQLTRFHNENKDMPTAWRLHIEPKLNFSFVNNYGSLNLETKLYATHYWQKPGNLQTNKKVYLKKHVSRVLPQLKLKFKTVLESDKQLFKGFNQTLEPMMQYLYRPHKNQNNIGSSSGKNLGAGYDSALVKQDYFSIFGDRYYSGLDNISSANQISIGATTRFIKEKTGQEYFNFSLGQVYRLSNSKIDNLSTNNNTSHSISWTLETNWKFNKNWNLNGNYQYDSRLNESALANISLQYKPDNDKVVQFNYRYASQHYIDQNLRSNQYGQDIKQLGVVVGWNVTDKLSIMASHYQDIALDKYVESQLGLTYNTCCWKATTYISRHLIPTPNGASDKPTDVYYDNSIGVNFELRFGSSYNTGVSKMLKKGLIPYYNEFDIN
ncbi:MAG: LPS assembly protein LptD [Pasteurella sp.]|nr:LPS assembly protein LptD [Pasteurella sp.]